jgi:acyl carrier protein
MVEQNDRLVRCFAAVFPNVRAEQIPDASVDNVHEWDSLASVTLVALLEEEFGAQIDLLDLPELTSFKAVQNYLNTHKLLL